MQGMQGLSYKKKGDRCKERLHFQVCKGLHFRLKISLKIKMPGYIEALIIQGL